MPAVVVFVTNILFSATGWRGNPFQCVELARTGQVQAVACAEILKELRAPPFVFCLNDRLRRSSGRVNFKP